MRQTFLLIIEVIDYIRKIKEHKSSGKVSLSSKATAAAAAAAAAGAGVTRRITYLQ